MISARMWKSIGVAGTGITGAMLIGLTKGFIEPTTNLFQTGITTGLLFGIWMIVVAIAIYKNRI